ncbi:hypothetical protein G6F57_014652 [Rhizopus arrhizus]|nr:hypothetical protein G6F30_012637 [Rhizopus arrhizus]KAG1396412.1 hypothetical protein G6F58_011741 [Rhizopus delemar]KAG0973584.1 hypothetical protein G6F29_012754 [Rhizopus arrhizus]KAG0976202.1 hypothetical protein G6F28_012721 [Rhizopus arrhizus]KAG1001572.1 hypothetical protein G6F27_012747 [Rhizopus arrhizus]
MPKSIPTEKQIDIKDAVLNNRKTEDIANEHHVHWSTVRRYARKIFPQRSHLHAGRPAIVPDATKQYIKLRVITGHLTTAKEAFMELGKLGTIKKRLERAKKHRNWSNQQWRRVVFSDETKINIWGSDGVKYYWARPNEVLRPHHIDFTVKHGGGYACQIYDGNMDSSTYQHILGTTYMDTLKHYSLKKTNVYLQHDNDPKHKSKSTIAWLYNNGVRYIDDWPAQGPDLNPIEHVWHQLKLNLSLYEAKARNVKELW